MTTIDTTKSVISKKKTSKNAREIDPSGLSKLVCFFLLNTFLNFLLKIKIESFEVVKSCSSQKFWVLLFTSQFSFSLTSKTAMKVTFLTIKTQTFS